MAAANNGALLNIHYYYYYYQQQQQQQQQQQYSLICMTPISLLKKNQQRSKQTIVHSKSISVVAIDERISRYFITKYLTQYQYISRLECQIMCYLSVYCIINKCQLFTLYGGIKPLTYLLISCLHSNETVIRVHGIIPGNSLLINLANHLSGCNYYYINYAFPFDYIIHPI